MAKKTEVDCLSYIKDAINHKNNARVDTANSDIDLIRKFIDSAKETGDDNTFPDFIFDGGVIEHFAISASKDTKKGFDYKICYSNFEKEVSLKRDEFKQQNFESNTIFSEILSNVYTKSSYNDFVYSFKKHFDKHIKSLDRSSYKDKIVVFMIEQLDGRLGIYENDNFKEFYLLNKDKKLLTLLEKYKIKVHYMIFKSTDSVELIDLSKLDLLMVKAKENLDIRGGRTIDLDINLQFDL